MKICCYWTSFSISFIWFPVFGNFKFLKWTVTCTQDFCIFNLRFVYLVYSLRFKYFFLESYRATTETLRKGMATNLTQLKWSTVRKITRLFLSSFCLNFDLWIFLSKSRDISSRVREITRFLVFRLIFHESFAFIFRCFLNASRYSSRMKFCCIWFRFCPLKTTVNSQLLWDVLSRGKEII